MVDALDKALADVASMDAKYTAAPERRLFARTPKATVSITTFHPNAIRHNVRTTTQPFNSRATSLIGVLIGIAVGLPLSWFFMHAINYLASAFP